MSEHKCVVSYCCCGCSLKSGSMAIGIVALILSLLNVIYGIYVGINLGTAVGWVSFVLNLIIAIVCILLIQGIRTERRSFVMAWVWTMTVLIIINIVVAVIDLIKGFDLSFGISLLIVMCIYIYLVIVVRSYGLSLGASPTVA